MSGPLTSEVILRANIEQTNNTDEDQIADYRTQYTQELLSKRSAVQGAVERFNIPGFLLPLFVFQDNTYKVAIRWGNAYQIKTVVWEERRPIPETEYNRRYVYEYQHMLDMINKAARDAYLDFKAADPLFPADVAPWIVYDSRLFRLLGEEKYWGNGSNITTPTADRCYFYLNYDLFMFFQNFILQEKIPLDTTPPDTPDPTDEWWYLPLTSITVNAVGNQTPPSVLYDAALAAPYNVAPIAYSCVKNEQEVENLSVWVAIKGIALLSNTLGNRPESIPAVQADTLGAGAGLPIISDFLITTTNGFDYRTGITYEPNVLRWFNMISDQGLTEIDIRAVWFDAKAQYFPVYISTNEMWSVKILFASPEVRVKRAIISRAPLTINGGAAITSNAYGGGGGGGALAGPTISKQLGATIEMDEPDELEEDDRKIGGGFDDPNDVFGPPTQYSPQAVQFDHKTTIAPASIPHRPQMYRLPPPPPPPPPRYAQPPPGIGYPTQPYNNYYTSQPYVAHPVDDRTLLQSALHAADQASQYRKQSKKKHRISHPE